MARLTLAQLALQISKRPDGVFRFLNELRMPHDGDVHRAVTHHLRETLKAAITYREPVVLEAKTHLFNDDHKLVLTKTLEELEGMTYSTLAFVKLAVDFRIGGAPTHRDFEDVLARASLVEVVESIESIERIMELSRVRFKYLRLLRDREDALRTSCWSLDA